MANSDKDKFHDHFSQRAPGYAIYRPTYPHELVDFLSELIDGRSSFSSTIRTSGSAETIVWEAGCGSGQLSGALAERFDRIIATDASPDQIAHARPHSRVEFRVARAEESGLPDHSIDLAIAAQAAHWFDLEKYYAEVRRVMRSGGFVALVVYGIHITDDPQIDTVVKRFYSVTLAGHWPPQRRFVEEGYRTLAFPFDEISSPQFEMRADWTLAEMLGYVETWSATGALAKTQGREKIEDFRNEVSNAWGDPQSRRTIRWPLSMRLGRV